MLRTFGKRTLSKMNAFDFIVTIALVSTLSTVALNNSVPLVDGLITFLLLISFQYIITWISVNNKRFKKLITSNPTMLVNKGNIYEKALRKERITEQELYIAIRENGYSTFEDVDVIVLETTGEISVIKI